MEANTRILAVARRALQEMPGVAVSTKNRGEHKESSGIEIRLAGQKPLRLEVLWLTEGWPSDVRLALDRLSTWSPHHLVVAAPNLSPGAIAELRKRGVNWMDERGNVRLVVPPGLALLKTAPPERRPARSFVWSRSKVLVAEILLSQPWEKHELNALSAQTGVSIPQVSNVLRAFERLGWTERHGPKRGLGVWRTVAKPGSMLEAWTAHLAGVRPEHRFGHRVFRDPMKFLEAKLAPILHERGAWAVTGWAGASLLAPFVTITPVLHIYVADAGFELVTEDIMRRANIRPVDSGANVEFWRAQGPLLLYKGTETRVPVVTAPRLYADLTALGGRGQDAAQHIRDTLIGY